MKKDRENTLINVIKNRKLPILTLDERWHTLFLYQEKDAYVKDLERRINDLLKKQGKFINDIKDMKKLKKKLMDEIVTYMDTGTDALGIAKSKRLERNKNFINELNEKIEFQMDELAEIPYQIKELNEELMIEGVKIFYENLDDGMEELNELTAWIAGMRDELKRKILLKQEIEAKNTLIYTYMHDMLGAQVMEIFDRKNTKK